MVSSISKASIRQCLQNEFGIAGFRPLQEEIITSILDKYDTFSILSTGSGKSLTYQLPARLLRPGLTLVVSPLLSLMEDQVKKAKGVRAATFHSGKSEEENKAVLEDTIKGNIDMLYVSPERLSSNKLMDAISKRYVPLFVIDEAHCISTWGHDFRPSYLFLPEIRKRIGEPPIALFTATAPPHIRDDITKVMKLEDYNLIQGDILRSNIDFSVVKITKKERILQEILERESRRGPIIVYGTTIKEVQEIAQRLSTQFKVGIYHSQLGNEAKKENYERFMTDDLDIMLCTSAFGMGVDKPNVRTIIHHSIPSSLEEYIQQAGRAGRDGNSATAILFYNPRDIKVQHSFITLANPSPTIIRTVYTRMYNWMERVTNYQGKPVSFPQVKLFLTDIEKNAFIKHRSDSALGILINLGYITMEGEYLIFPHGKEITIPEDIIEAKRKNDYRRLQMIERYALSEGNHTEIIRQYFSGATSDLVERTEDITTTIKDKILGFIARYKERKGKIGEILSGESFPEQDYENYKGSLPFLGSETVLRELEDITIEGYAKEVAAGKHFYYTLTEKGIDYLQEREILPLIKPSVIDNVLDFRYGKAMTNKVLAWFQSFDFNNGWQAAYKSFINAKFTFDDQEYTGETLLHAFSGSNKSSIMNFGQFIEHVLEINTPFTKVNETKGVYRRVSNQRKQKY